MCLCVCVCGCGWVGIGREAWGGWGRGRSKPSKTVSGRGHGRGGRGAGGGGRNGRASRPGGRVLAGRRAPPSNPPPWGAPRTRAGADHDDGRGGVLGQLEGRLRGGGGGWRAGGVWVAGGGRVGGARGASCRQEGPPTAPPNGSRRRPAGAARARGRARGARARGRRTCRQRTVPMRCLPHGWLWMSPDAAPRCARPVGEVKDTRPTVTEQRRGSASGEEEME